MNAPDQRLLDALLDSWDRNNTILVNLLRALPEGGLQVRAMEGGPTIADLCTHIHFVRLVFVFEDAPEFARKPPEREWLAEHDPGRIAQMLNDSAAVVRDAVKSRVAAGRHMDLHYDHPILLPLHGGTGCYEDRVHAGRDHFLREYQLIQPDARGHGRSSNPDKTITHRQCALDMLALVDHLGIQRCRAIGLSMGGNILLHMATMQPQRTEGMVVVSATMHFPEQARELMRQVPAAENQPAQM